MLASCTTGKTNNFFVLLTAAVNIRAYTKILQKIMTFRQ